MGEVFEAVSKKNGHRVAIKLQRLGTEHSSQHGKRLLIEAHLLESLDHPSIIRCHKVGALDDGRVYLVMEFATGEPLRAHLDPGGLPLGFLCAIGQQIAEAMAYAHARQVLHRDLKPDNILLKPEPGLPYGYRACVLDFSIGKQVGQRWLESPNTALETGDALLGTPAYMSPEQCLRNAVNDRSDVYSLGVLLFEALIGSLPFAADSQRSVLTRHIEESPPSLKALAAQVPTELDELVQAMLAKRPAERPAMSEVAARLAKLTTVRQARGLLNTALSWRRLRLLSWIACGASLCAALLYCWLRLTSVAPHFVVIAQDIIEPVTITDADVYDALRRRLGSIEPERVRIMHVAPLRTSLAAAHTIDFVAAQREQTHLVETELRPLLRAHPQARVVYLGMAPISLTLHLGFLVGEMTQPLVFHRPPRADWQPSGSDAQTRELKLHTEGLPATRSTMAGEVVVRISASARIDPDDTRRLVPAPLSEIDIVIENPDRQALASPQEIETVASAFRSALTLLSQRLPKIQRIHLFSATAPGLTFRLGSVISPTMHVPVQTYEYLRAAKIRYLPGITLSAAL